ncbi:MAG TPA: hypothetical protein VF060_08820 [Trebonia sp.]
MRQIRFRAVIALHPAVPGTAPTWPRHAFRHRHQGLLPVSNPRSTAQTGPGAPTSLVPADDARGQYLNRTHELMLRAESREKPGFYRSFSAELAWDDDVPLHPGERHVITVTLTDDDAPVFFWAGQRFTLWSGGEVGHGTISRRVFSEHGPS